MTTTPTATRNPGVRAALAAAERGWCVFPTISGGKRPAVRAWEKRATTDPDRIRTCWSAGPYGIGVACGPSNLLVLDLDRPKPDKPTREEHRAAGIVCGHDVLAALCEDAGQPWPPATYTVATPSGGQHLYYRQPAGAELRSTVDRLGWCIDTRGRGGYVIAAGTHLENGTYTVLDDAPVAELPGWLAGRLTAAGAADVPAPTPVELRSGQVGTYAEAALTTQVAHVRGATAGRRNFTLYMAAQNLGQLVAGGMVDEPTVRDVLLAAAEPHLAAGAYTRQEAVGTIRSGLRAGAKRPRCLTNGSAA